MAVRGLGCHLAGPTHLLLTDRFYQDDAQLVAVFPGLDCVRTCRPGPFPERLRGLLGGRAGQSRGQKGD